MYPSLRPYTCTYMQLGYNSLQHASVSFYVLPADFSNFASEASQWKVQFKKELFFCTSRLFYEGKHFAIFKAKAKSSV